MMALTGPHIDSKHVMRLLMAVREMEIVRNVLWGCSIYKPSPSEGRASWLASCCVGMMMQGAYHNNRRI